MGFVSIVRENISFILLGSIFITCQCCKKNFNVLMFLMTPIKDISYRVIRVMDFKSLGCLLQWVQILLGSKYLLCAEIMWLAYRMLMGFFLRHLLCINNVFMHIRSPVSETIVIQAARKYILRFFFPSILGI